MSIPRETILDHLARLEGVDTLDDAHTRFFYYDPHRDTPHDKRLPFATVIDADDYDTVSNLSRPGVYRVNFGVTRATYRALLGPEPKWGKDGGIIDTDHDFTQLDTFLLHPTYAPMAWMCILAPTNTTWPTLQRYLQEAHETAKEQYEKRRSAKS